MRARRTPTAPLKLLTATEHRSAAELVPPPQRPSTNPPQYACGGCGAVLLSALGDQGRWDDLALGVTDADGRVGDLLTAPPGPGVHWLRFDTAAYFAATGQAGFHPEVTVAFEVADGRRHVHVPLLLSPYSYTTYRGS